MEPPVTIELTLNTDHVDALERMRALHGHATLEETILAALKNYEQGG